MRTPLHALTWELWRLSRWDLGARVFGQCALWGGVFAFFGKEEPGMQAVITLVPLLLIGSSLFSSLLMSSFDNRRSGFSFYLGFTRPISTPLLVAVPMIYIGGTAALCYLIPAAFLRLTFDLPLPLLPIAAFVGAASGGFTMAVWFSQSYGARLTAFAAVGLCFWEGAVSWMRRLPGVRDAFLVTPDVLFASFSLSLRHYALLAALFAGSVAVAILAVDRQRHGETWLTKRSGRGRAVWASGAPRRSRPFATRVRAQFWFEMRRSGVRVLLAGFGAACIAFLGMVVANMDAGFGDEADVLWIVMLVLWPSALVLLGAEWMLGLSRRQGAVWLSTFDATQAMDNARLVLVKLAVLTVSVVLSWMMIASAAALWATIWGSQEVWSRVGASVWALVAEAPVRRLSCVAIILAVSYTTACALLISFGLFLALRPRLVAAGFFVTGAHAVVALWDAKHGCVLKPFWEVYGWLLATALVAATFLALRKALVEEHAIRAHLVAVLCVWAAYLGAAAGLYAMTGSIHARIPTSLLAFGAASLCIPLLSIALAPLILAAHRHR